MKMLQKLDWVDTVICLEHKTWNSTSSASSTNLKVVSLDFFLNGTKRVYHRCNYCRVVMQLIRVEQ